MNYQNKDNLTYKKRRIQPYGGGDPYGGDNRIHYHLKYLDDGYIEQVEDNTKFLLKTKKEVPISN